MSHRLARDLRAQRERLGWSVDFLADQVGLNPGSLYNIETGRRGVSIDTAELLAHAMGRELGLITPTLPTLTDSRTLRPFKTGLPPVPDSDLAPIVVEIRAHRWAARWAQSDLANASGVWLSTLQQIEQGKAAPELPTLTALAAAFQRRPGLVESTDG